MAGGSGYIGRALAAHLVELSITPVILSRGYGLVGFENVRWDGRTQGDWTASLESAAAVVNLSGEPISQKWTPANMSRMIESRVVPTRALAEALASLNEPPPVWINFSGTGVYGDRKYEALDESSPISNSIEFLPRMARLWEGAALDGELPHTRRILLRVGVVLGRGGGALEPLLNLTKWFLGGQAGNGSQYLSWIHIHDLVRSVSFLLKQGSEAGPVNATAPAPVTNAEFMVALRRIAGRPWSPPVPALAMRLAGRLGGPDPSLVLTGQRVFPRKLEAAGFSFRYPSLELALRDLVR